MASCKRLALLLILALAMLPVWGTTQSAHAGGDWFAYIYNGQTQELLRVHLSGKVETVPVTFGEAVYLGAYDMTFSSDGEYMAYCSVSSAADGTQQTTLAVWQLMNYDNTAFQLYQIDMGNPIGCRVGHPGINSDETLLAVGLVNYFPGDPNADTMLPPWSLQVFDLNSGELLYEMNQSTPGFSQVPGWENAALMPDVVYFDNDLIVFRQLPWGVGGPGIAMPAYMWNVSTGNIATVEAYGAVALDYLMQTGELAWIELNPDLPAGMPAGPMPQANVVKFSDKTGNPPRTIYTNGTDVISDVQFIDGGQRLAIQLIAAFDPAAPPEQGSAIKWVGLDRQGQVTDLETDIFTYSEVHYGPEGYIYFQQSFSDMTQYTGSSYSLEYVHPDGARSPLWQADGQTWEYVWGMGWAVKPDLGAFPEAALP